MKTPTLRSAVNEVKSHVLSYQTMGRSSTYHVCIYSIYTPRVTDSQGTQSQLYWHGNIPSGSVVANILSVKSLCPAGLTKATVKKYVVYGVSWSIVCTTTSCSNMLKSTAFSLCVVSIVPPSMPYMTTYSASGPFLRVAVGGAHVRSMLRSSMFMKLKFRGGDSGTMGEGGGGDM